MKFAVQLKSQHKIAVQPDSPEVRTKLHKKNVSTFENLVEIFSTFYRSVKKESNKTNIENVLNFVDDLVENARYGCR